jgi:beta-glucosidase
MSQPAYRDSTLSIDERAADLLERMTLEEKVAQLGAVWAASIIDEDRFSSAKAEHHLQHGAGQLTRVGASTVLRPTQSAALLNDVQRWLIEHTRLGIPTILHEESCAGLVARDATQFPQAIGLASSWNPELVQEIGDVIRRQMLAVGARQTLAPVLDIARDPRWGRAEETFGEDPYLVARMGVAYVRGVQGDSLREGVAATAKHFMGYGASEGGLNWAPSLLPIRELRERILPPFEAAIREAGLASVMNGYQEIDGIPCGASKWLLDDLLRGELEFDGLVVADYFTVTCLMTYHRIAADKSEAGARCLEAGLDIELPTVDCYGAPLQEAIARGRIDEALIDRSVRRVLRLKLQLGLFENPYVDAENAASVFETPEQRALARRAAQESAVLLKNDGGLLPLDPTLGRIAVIGPSADSRRLLQGDYSYPTHVEIVFGPVREAAAMSPQTEADASPLLPSQRAQDLDLLDCFTETITLLEGIRSAVSERTEVSHARGCDLQGDSTEGFDEAVALARDSDVAIVVVGGKSGLLRGCSSGEFNDRADLALTGVQSELIRAIAATGTPTVVVLVNGRPLALTDFFDQVPAVLEAWLPGEEGGHGVADVLFGAVSPSGRLPVTLPRSVGQLPLYYNHKPSGARSQMLGDYSDLPCSPLLPFGHGLSYTRFEYSSLRLSDRSVSADEMLEISLRVDNVGDRAGTEVVQLYVNDVVASVTRPVKELKGFARIELEPGRGADVTFELDLGQLGFYDREMRYVVEPGEVRIMLGASSENIRLEALVSVETRDGVPRALRPADVVPTRVEVSSA